MNANFAPSTPQRPAPATDAVSAPSPALRRAILVGMAVCAALALGSFGITVLTPATAVFPILTWVMFTALWAAGAAALLLRPYTLNEVWRELRRLPLLLQGLAWLLFLPLMLGLWVWASTWPLALRLILIVGLGAWNVFVFFPRGL
jgi:hypothetical protein